MIPAGSLPRKVLAALAIAGLAPAAFAGSSLTSGGTSWISSENNGGKIQFKVSVHPAAAGYSGLYDADEKPPAEEVNEPFNDLVRAYRFWAVSRDSKRVETLTQSGNIVGEMQSTISVMRSESWLQLWEKTDPNGHAFSSTADFSNSTAVSNVLEASGSIDVSGMTSGSIYFIYGAYRSTPKFLVRMRGSTKAAEINLGDVHSGDLANNNEFYIARVDFVNEDGHQSIDWQMPLGANNRFSGIVVTSAKPIR